MWKNIDEKIVSVKGFCLTSKFSESKIFGQHLGVKTFGGSETRSLVKKTPSFIAS